jgi:hypothetical protein
LFLWDCQLDWGQGADWFACLRGSTGYLTSPSRRDPPTKNIYQKETGLQKKVRGGFPCESFHRICEKNVGGWGVFYFVKDKGGSESAESNVHINKGKYG